MAHESAPTTRPALSASKHNLSSHSYAGTEPEDVEDGPLFAAIISALFQRKKHLSTSIKAIIKAVESSIDIAQSNLSANAALDASIEALSRTSATHRSESLSGLADRIAGERTKTRQSRLQELKALEELTDRLKGSYDRLKQLDGRKKTFEAESKRYYEDIGKYLAQTDASKFEASDQKQAARKIAFQELRVDFSGFIEGLVEAEEKAVTTWLHQWAGSPDPEAMNSDFKRVPNRQRSLRESARQNLEQSLRGFPHSRESSENGQLSEAADSMNALVSGSSGFSNASEKTSDYRRRRLSMPVEREGGTRDRIKGFIKTSISTAQTSLQSPLTRHSSQRGTDVPLSPTVNQPARPFSKASGVSESPNLLSPQQASTRTYGMGTARKKEGFLWATSRPGSTAVEDGSGHWHKLWAVLSEGQIIEFSNWRTNLSVKNSPINLRFATARACRPNEVDRRFCFLVIGQNVKRIYQAVSQQEADEWVAAISKSIESLIDGTSSVRRFDASRLSGTSTPYRLHDFGGSSTDLIGEGSLEPATSMFSTSTNEAQPTRFSWMGSPLSRRASLGGPKRSRRQSSNDVEARLSPPALIIRKPSRDTPRHKHQSNLSEGSLQHLGLGLSATSSRGASRSDGSFSSADEDETSASDIGLLCDFDKAIVANVNRMRPDRPTTKQDQTYRVQQLVQQPGNRTCADCRAADPRWASWNIGVFLCIRCSGQHRSLGTHISRVRALDLDDWSDEQAANMERWGNTTANAFWEAHKPSDLLADDASIADYIKRKYVAREWVEVSVLSSLGVAL